MNDFEKDMLIKILNKQIEDGENIREILELQKDIIETNLNKLRRSKL